MLETEQMNFINPKALKMMNNMGYKKGSALGKHNNGKIEPLNISRNLGKRGLGLKIQNLEASNELWDFNAEEIAVEEEVDWISNSENKRCYPDSFNNWIVRGLPKLDIENENKFCNPLILQKVLKAKDIFNELDVSELNKARCRANPFETIRSAIFMNRAALKIANIDAATNFIFTDIDKNRNHSKSCGPYYFADVCAGPGGFTEYILWRKKWAFKGFGFTLKADHDFTLDESFCASPVTFGAHYGACGDGDICNPENIEHFAKSVLHETESNGVHFMMSDGGFSVDGNENLQEILSKQLYLCQCLTALKIVRTNGNFVTKLFDVFTEFSVGLVYLMYQCFEKVAIFKPNASRPANAERYLICYGKKEPSDISIITEYLTRIADELWDLHQIQKSSTTDINEIVSLSVINADRKFFQYIVNSNNSIGTRQVLGLKKLAVFCRNPTLIEPRQDKLRKQCLRYWRIPDKPKAPLPRFNINDLLNVSVVDPGFMLIKPKFPKNIEHLSEILKERDNWYYTTLGGTDEKSNCFFYAGVSNSRATRLFRSRWTTVNRLRLVRGTLLYGEMVKEIQIVDGNEIQKQSLHVIDALRLGDISLNDMEFHERCNLIYTYCQAVNHESQTNSIRIRPKYFSPLLDTTMLSIFSTSDENELDCCSLEPLGFKSTMEYYEINSVLLLNVSSDQQFISTFVQRLLICFNRNNKIKSNVDLSDKEITANSLIELFKVDV